MVAPLFLGAVSAVVSHVVPGKWWSELLGLGMPLVLGGTLLVLVLTIALRPPIAYRIPPFVAFLLALAPLGEAFQMRLPRSMTGHDFSVMSFNAALFNPDRPSTLESEAMLYRAFYDHLRQGTAPDVLCVQEFYHSHINEELTADPILHLGGYRHFYTNPKHNKHYDGLVGVITFSKFPILASGRLDFGDPEVYNGHWVDIGTDAGTVRVFNLQLNSMSIRWARFSRSPLRNIAFNLWNIHDRLRKGYIERAHELRDISVHLEESPHPTIVCADLNALPWSATYQWFKRRFRNAHEAAGSGPGFTYHHFPWFIRIDHQFASPDFHIPWSRTHQHIRISDHYPIETGYRLGR